MLSRCLTPTFSDTELPPQEPQPSVREGVKLEVVQIADAALGGGGVHQDAAGLHAAGKLIQLGLLGKWR